MWNMLGSLLCVQNVKRLVMKLENVRLKKVINIGAESNIVDKEGFTNVQKSNKNVHNVNGLQNNIRDQQGLFWRKVRQEFRRKEKVKRVRDGKYAQEEEE
nr:hypothetical protein [Tanacetum cinerariifolium]